MHPSECDGQSVSRMNKKLKSTAVVERRASRRLAEKHKIDVLSQECSRSFQIAESNTGPSEADSLNHSKDTSDSKSKSFLDCLELQPVEVDSSNELANADDSYTLNTKAADKVKKETENVGPQLLPNISKKCQRKPRKHVKHRKRCQKIDLTEGIENNSKLISDSEKQQDKLLTDLDKSNLKTELLQSANHGLVSETQMEDCVTAASNQDLVSETNMEDCVTAASDHAQLNKSDDRISPVYIFRDVNKVAHSVCPEDSTTDLFLTVDLNSHGKKRRYDKLIKKLVDSEKTLEVNLREVKHNDLTNKVDINLCVEKMKEKLRIREKKKYEYLINYMRDQWKVDQKSFQDLLPQKVDIVKENVVRQLGASTNRVVTEKRKRGRPRKDNKLSEKMSESPSEDTKQRKQSEQNHCRKPLDSRELPIKLQKNASLSSVSLGRRVEKFRIGIVDKNGGQEIIELNKETLQGVNLFNVVDNIPATASYDKQETKISDQAARVKGRNICVDHTSVENVDHRNERNQTSQAALDNSGDSCQTAATLCNIVGGDGLLQEVVDKCPPTTISLPSISSLEKDYELVSLSPTCPSKIGNFYNDQFFIPQSTFDQDGKTSMIIVGPFCLVCDPKPRLLLVSPDEHKKGPTMILRKKIHSPSSTPPRDFRIHKESRWARTHHKTCSVNERGQQGDPEVIFHDHDYMTPPELRDNVRRYSKAVAKHSANVKFIDARVENITEREDNFVVTIKGDNMLHQVKNLANSSQAPMPCNKDGMPVIYSLGQVMTSALMKAEQSAQREKLALESQQTGDYTPVVFPLSAMGDVVVEVLIPPGGTELLPRTRNRQLFMEESPVMDTAVPQPPGTELGRSNQEIVFLHNNGAISVENCHDDVRESITVEHEGDDHVVIENADSVDRGALPGLPCCRVCLHLFPRDYMLYHHVRSNHPNCEVTDSVYLEQLRAQSHLTCPNCEVTDSVYLQQLRAQSHLTCPICSNPPAFLATSAKLRRHLRVIHGIEHYVETCRFCHAEFVDKQELDLHMGVSHNKFSWFLDSSVRITPLKRLGPHRVIFTKTAVGGLQPTFTVEMTFAGRRLVSLLKPPQSSHLLKGQRSVLSDYLSCNRCNIAFSDCVSLLSHTLKVHPELNQFNMCRLCDRLFDSTVSLHKHLKKVHAQTHDGALKCPFCPAWLSSMELASIHRVTLHTGAVPVHCPFCGAGYQNLHLMYNHVRNQHLQTEAHVCPQCHTSFPTSRLLSEHMRKAHVMSPRIIKEISHSGCNMSYCCPFCTMSFIRTYDLAVHVVNAHKDCLLPSQCQMCMQSFVNDVVMKMHMSGAHGIDMRHEASSADSSYVHGHFEDSESVTVVLQDDTADLYTHTKDLDASSHSRTLMRGHLIDTQDILDTQEPDQYIELRDEETIVYLRDRNHIVTSGEMFGSCSAIEDVQLLGETHDDFNLHAVDYLETLTNDSIAVGADVVADVSIDEMTDSGDVNGEQGNRNEDILEMTSQFEIDGVLYELSVPHDCPEQDLSEVASLTVIDDAELRLSCERITMDANDLAHLLRQQVQ